MIGVVVSGWVLTGCGSDRPDPTAWKGSWDTIATSVVDVIEVPSGDAVALAGEDRRTIVRSGMQVRSELLPAPSEELDRRVAEWADLVEAVGEDCAGSPEVDAIARDISVLTDEINGLIEDRLPPVPTR